MEREIVSVVLTYADADSIYLKRKSAGDLSNWSVTIFGNCSQSVCDSISRGIKAALRERKEENSVNLAVSVVPSNSAPDYNVYGGRIYRKTIEWEGF